MVERGVTNLIHDLGPTAGGYKVTATGYSPATSEEEQTRFNGGLSESKQRKGWDLSRCCWCILYPLNIKLYIPKAAYTPTICSSLPGFSG